MTVEQFRAFYLFFFHVQSVAVTFLANIFNVTDFMTSTTCLFCLRKAGKNRHAGIFHVFFFGFTDQMFLTVVCYESSFDTKMQPFSFLRNILIKTSDLESFLLKHFRCTHFIILYIIFFFIFGESGCNSRHLRCLNLDINDINESYRKKCFFMFIFPSIADLYQ